MTNFEFYKDKILEIGDVSEIALTKDGELCKCSDTTCFKCKFNKLGGCLKTVTKWLCEEHVEKSKLPKLTKKERLFCELIKTGYLFRENNNKLYWSHTMPIKLNDKWDYSHIPIQITPYFDVEFDFIEKSHSLPAEIERLLELEVEE